MFNKTDRARYLRLLQFVRPQWRIALLAACATLVYGLTEPLVPYVMQPLIDGGFAKRDMETVHTMVIVLVIGFVIRGAANFLSMYTTTQIAQHVVYRLRERMFGQLLDLPMAYFDGHSHGGILSRFSYDVVQLMSATTDALIRLLRESITIFALLVYLFYLDWRMSLILMIAAPFLSYIIVFISRRLRTLAHALQADMSGMNHVIDEALRGREIIRIYGGKDHEYARFDREADAVQRHALQAKKISALASPLLEVIIITALAAVIVIAANKAQVSPQQMTAGKFVAFLGTMALLFPPIKRLGQVNEPIQRGLAAAQSVFEFLDEAPEEEQKPSSVSLRDGAVRFDQVSFRYGKQAVLENFTLEIRAGETIALVGESGSGKSTVVALLAGFYRPDAGEISIDGCNLADISLCERRRAMAYVSQETVLFVASVAANIAYADPRPDRQRIIAAAASANADGFIGELPEGYDSDIGQQGGRLSGGQKQRIAIARALYKNAPILILDEATSALDNRSEQKVQDAIDTLRKNRTAIIIAHRLSTIRNADRIVVLDHGNIVESGSHDQLIAKNGFYATLLNRLSS